MRKRIKALAAERNLTITEVERMGGMKSGTIRRWDNHTPRSDNLAAVANILGTTGEYPLYGKA